MGINIEKLKEKFDRKSAQRTDRFNMKDGDNYIRILPPSIEYFSDDLDYISYEFLTHFNLGTEGDFKAEICPKTVGKSHKCPICEAVYKLYKTNTAEDKTLASSLRAKVRHIFNVIDLDDVDKGVQVLETGPKIYEKILVFATNPKYGDLLDLDKGRNITITRTPGKETSSGYTEYDVIPDPDVTSIREKLTKNFKETIVLLSKQVPVPKSYDELKAVLEGEEYTPKEGTVEKIEREVKGEEPTPELEVKVVSKVGEKPECFGVDYGPKRDACLKCEFKADCRKAFLEI